MQIVIYGCYEKGRLELAKWYGKYGYSRNHNAAETLKKRRHLVIDAPPCGWLKANKFYGTGSSSWKQQPLVFLTFAPSPWSGVTQQMEIAKTGVRAFPRAVSLTLPGKCPCPILKQLPLGWYPEILNL